jgi:hypothetical protein
MAQISTPTRNADGSTASQSLISSRLHAPIWKGIQGERRTLRALLSAAGVGSRITDDTGTGCSIR